MTTTTSYPSQDRGTERYFLMKSDLWGHFYSLTPGQRASIILREMLYIMLFLCGWIAFSIYLRYGHFMVAELFSLSAWAQDAASKVSAQEQLYKYVLWLAINLSLVVVMLGCVTHMLLAKRKNQWVAKTATFLLGFLTKSVGALLP